MLVMPLLMEMIMLIGDNAGVNYDTGLTDAPNNTTKDTLIELREKQHYEKPSSKRNKAKASARIREQKRQRDDKRNKF